MKIKRIKMLAAKIFKTVSEINLNFMKTVFTFKVNSRVQPFGLLVKSCNTEKYSSKSIMTLGPKIWNAHPENVKKTHPLANARNILNHGQVRLANAKFV